MEYNLVALGFPAVAATSPGRVVHAVRHIGAKDVVVAINFKRGLRQTVEGLATARGKGAYCVAITNTLASPLVRLAKQTFLAPVEIAPLAVSYMAPIARMCNPSVARLIARSRGIAVENVGLPSVRPPARPVILRTLRETVE